MTLKQTIGIIGAGNMGQSILGGLINHGHDPNSLWVIDNHPDKLQQLSNQYRVNSTTSLAELLKQVEIIIVAVKPSAMQPTLESMHPYCRAKQLCISVAAGITTTQIKRWLNQPEVAIVRAMPNTPALIGEGMSGLFAQDITADHRASATACLDVLGETIWVEDEALLHVVTALCGSGPAYFFYVMESLVEAAVTLGLPTEIARKLTCQTAKGSALLAIHHEQSSLGQLREQVTSKGGTTAAGIKALKDGKLTSLIFEALNAATTRSKELSQEFD